MAQTNYTPIQLYYSTTATAAPTAGNLASGELAINITDGKLFYKDNAGVVQTLATKSATSGTFGAISVTSETNSGTLTLSGGTANGVAYLNGSKVLTTGSALTFDGTTLSNNGAIRTSDELSALGGRLVLYRAAGASYFDWASGQDLVWRTVTSVGGGGAAEQMRLTSTGLGIGTSSVTSISGYTALKINNDTTGAILDLAQANTVRGRLVATNSSFTLETTGSIPLIFSPTGTERMRLDSAGNLGLGVTPSASSLKMLQGPSDFVIGTQSNGLYLANNAYYNSGWKYAGGGAPSRFSQDNGAFQWHTAPSGTAGNAITFTQAMTLDASGNLLVGATSGGSFTPKMRVIAPGSQYGAEIQSNTVSYYAGLITNTATSGDNYFLYFGTEANGASQRGSITYNRAGGLTVFSTTSDYRAKDIIGPVVDSGALIDSVPVYIGKMKGATQERPMFIAHETPEYAHIGKKDAVDADGNPVYQQMDASTLVPVMWAEIQSLRKRLAAAGI